MTSVFTRATRCVILSEAKNLCTDGCEALHFVQGDRLFVLIAMLVLFPFVCRADRIDDSAGPPAAARGRVAAGQ